MYRQIATLIFFVLTTAVTGQDCDIICAFFQSGSEIANDNLDCPCFSKLFSSHSKQYEKARQENDFFGQGSALDKMARIADLPLKDKLKDSFNIEYLFKYGVYNKTINNIDHSKKIFEEILDLIGDPKRNGGAYFETYNLSLHQLAEIATSKSKYNEAIGHLQHAIDLELQRVKGSEEEAIIFSMQCRMGYNYSQLGNHTEAYKYYLLGNKRMKEALPKLSRETIKRNADYFIGYFSWEVKELLELGLFADAFNLLNTIQEIQIPDHPRNSNTFQLWAEYFQKTSQIDSAKLYFEKAREGILSQSNNEDKFLSYTVKYAKFLSAQGNEEMALRTLDSATVLIAALKSQSSKWSKDMINLEVETIKLLYRSGELKKALDKIKDLSSELERRLNGAVIFEDHISFIQEFYPTFELGLKIIFENYPDKLALAYELIESTKAISLYKSSKLSSASHLNQQSSILTRYRMLSSEANQMKHLQALGDSTLDTRTRLYALTSRMETLKKALLPSDQQDFVDLTMYQEGLDGQDHILSFAGQNHYYFLKITENDASLHRRDARSIESLAKRYIQKISKFESINHREAAKEMGLFLEQIILSENSSHILFTGDGLLSQVPIESMITSDGAYFLSKANITYAPSARIQYFLNTKKIDGPPRAVVFRPDFNDANLPLLYAESEGKEIQEVTSGDLFTKNGASKVTFMESSGDYNIIHLATHAKAIDNDPSKSFIQFADSKLYFDEIKSLVLNAQLVCLSACETNTGKSYNGEGVQSLSRNFIAAGAQSIVSSLWEIPDQNTSEISIAFYRNLKKGFSKSEALQRAKIAFIENHPEEGSHPYNWAGLVLTGNDQAIYKKSTLLLLASGSGVVVSTFLLILSLAGNSRKPQNSPA